MLKRRAFTYVELMIAVLVMAILTIAALPSGEDEGQLEADGAAKRLEADLIYARNLSVAKPGDKVLLKVDPDGNKYWLAKESSPDTPIEHPVTKKPYVVEFGADGNDGLEKLEIAAVDFGVDDTLKFDSTGTLINSEPPTITFAAGDEYYEVKVSPIQTRVTMAEVGKPAELVVPAGNAGQSGEGALSDPKERMQRDPAV